MFGRLKQMLVKEFLQMFRDPRMRAIVFFAPVMQMLVIAFVLTTDVTDIRTALLDLDNSLTSREVIREFTASGHFEVEDIATSPADMRRLLDKGLSRVVIHFPAGFENDLKAGRTPQIQLISDGTDSNDSAIIFGYANQIVDQYVKRKRSESADSSGAAGALEIESRAWFNANLESKYYYVPGLIAVMLMVISLLLTSIAVVREKEIGTIEQVMVTPIRKIEFILGKTVPYMITGYITMTIMFGIAMLVFGVRIAGSWLLLYAFAGVYIAGNLGLALTISVTASTQQQALLTAFFILMPGVLLSGFLFPLDNMPLAVQVFAWLNPMRWFLDILRGITLKGTGVSALWLPMLAQLSLAVVFILLAAVKFRKTLV